MTTGTPETTPSPHERLRGAVDEIARAIPRMPNGDQAELRRAGPNDPPTPALYKLLLDIVEPAGHLPGGSDDARITEAERAWGTLATCVAFTEGLHDHATPFGKALALAGWSELRFVRLLRARGEHLHDALRQIARFVSSRGQRLDWTDALSLLLHQEDDSAEPLRRRVARSYYTTLYHEEKP